ncbi:MAG: hypothetical protein WCS94_22675, partial [Verrucomicrobiota bacterium]
TSGSYANDGSFGGFGGLVTASASLETDRTGYAGQLYEVTAFTLSAPSTNLNEDASMPLFAAQFLDDGTVTPANGFVQWSFAGPIAGVNPAGIITAGEVAQNTPAWVGARLDGWAASIQLSVVFTGIYPGYNLLSGQLASGNAMRLSFVGSNGSHYALDKTFNLAPPIHWTPQVTNLAGLNGVLFFTNQPNPATNNFWRVRAVP